MNILTYIQEKIRNKLYSIRKEKSKTSFPISCKIYGVKKGDRQSALAQSRVGDPLQLVHTPTEYYPNQVYVYSVNLNRVLGYIEKELAEKLVYVFGKGFCRDGKIHKIIGGVPYKYFGCVIHILESREFMKDCENFSSLHGE